MSLDLGRTCTNPGIKEDLASLRTYEEREDSERYIDILREVFRIFGEGIITSLEYTMSDYLA